MKSQPKNKKQVKSPVSTHVVQSRAWLRKILKTEWNTLFAKLMKADAKAYNPKFVQGMQDRMVVSFCKYGFVSGAAGKIDMLKSLIQRVDKYVETKNTEFLMDAANFAMIEFMFPQVEGAHHNAIDSPRGVDPVKSIPAFFECYRETKVTAYLVRAAVTAMEEFDDPSIDGAIFQPTDSDQSPGRTRIGGAVDKEHNIGASTKRIADRHAARDGD